MDSRKDMQYEVNKDFPNVYNVTGQTYGLIPVFIRSHAGNLIVDTGDWIIYEGNKVAVVKKDAYEPGCTDIEFHTIR